jgi:protein SCO1/2
MLHRRSRPARPAAVAVVLALALSACAAATHVTPSASATPANGSVLDIAVPAATAALPLVDEAGHRLTLASLAGTTVVLVDFLTLCQEVCPLTSADVRQVSEALATTGAAGPVRILETTVDPERDTTARLAAYQRLFGARPNWSFVTGSSADIAALWKSFGVATERTATTASPAPRDWLTGKPLTYDVDHQDVVIVIGPDGHERWLVNGMPRLPASAAVPAPLESFLNGAGLANQAAPPDPSWTPQDVLAAIAYVTGTATPLPS